MGSCGLVPWLLKKAFETRPCVRIKFYSLGWKGKCELAIETWGCWRCQQMCSICEGDLQTPKCSLEIRWCTLLSKCIAWQNLMRVRLEKSSVGLIFPWSSIDLPCRNRNACSVSLQQDNLPFDFTAHSSGAFLSLTRKFSLISAVETMKIMGLLKLREKNFILWYCPWVLRGQWCHVMVWRWKVKLPSTPPPRIMCLDIWSSSGAIVLDVLEPLEGLQRD